MQPCTPGSHVKHPILSRVLMQGPFYWRKCPLPPVRRQGEKRGGNSMGPCKAEQGRESRRGAPVQVGRGCGCWKAPQNSEVGFGFGLSAKPGARTGRARGEKCHSSCVLQCPCRCSSSETLKGEREGDVPKAWLLWEKGWLCLFILLCFIIPSERKGVVTWKVFFCCGAKVAVVQAGWNHSLRKVAICAIALVQPYKIRPSNSSQSEDRKRETKPKYILL